MKLSKSMIQKRNTVKKQQLPKYAIPDGSHLGQIKNVDYSEENDRLYVTVELDGDEKGTTFKFSADLADFAEKPLADIIDPFLDDEDNFDLNELSGYDAEFSTVQNTSRKTGKVYSNITEWSYITDELEEDEED